jgi:hypothetical protein
MKALKVLWILGYGIAAAAYPAGAVVAGGASDVIQISPADPKSVEVRREMIKLGVDTLDKNDPRAVAQVYGTVMNEGKPVRVLFVPQEWLLRPEENPKVTLLLADPAKGQKPLQAQTVTAIAFVTSVCALAGSSLLLGLWLLLRRRKAAEPKAA